MNDREKREQKRITSQKVILKKEDKFLILLRSVSAIRFPGLWDFPGGILEVDEDPMASVCREVREETQMDIELGNEVGRYAYEEGVPVDFIVYTAKAKSEDVMIGEEHSEFRWATVDEIRQLPTMPFVDQLLKDLSRSDG